MPIPRPAPGDTKWWITATVGILLSCTLAVWWGLASTLGKPSWTVMSYRVIDDRTVDVTYLVSRPTSRDVTCELEALDANFGTVGLVEVHVPGSDTTSIRQTTQIRTTARAVTGDITTCTIG